MVGGAALVGAWCVGLLLIVGSLLVAGDALLRESPAETARAVRSTHEDVLERYRRAR